MAGHTLLWITERLPNTPPRPSEISEKNWSTYAKPFLTSHSWYRAMLKVWRKSWEPFRIYQLTSTANPAKFHKLWSVKFAYNESALTKEMVDFHFDIGQNSGNCNGPREPKSIGYKMMSILCFFDNLKCSYIIYNSKLKRIWLCRAEKCEL